MRMDGQQEDQRTPLEQFGRNLVEEVKKGKMDPVIGRDEEIRNVIRILSRKTKNNPVLNRRTRCWERQQLLKGLHNEL